MRKFKRIISGVLVLVCIMCMCNIHAAAAYTYTTSFNQFGWHGNAYGYWKYLVYKNSVQKYHMMHEYDVCPPIYHTKNGGTTTLGYQNSVTYGGETAASFSASAGGTAKQAIVEKTVEVTGSLSVTRSFSVSAAGSVERTIESSASTGYYKLTLCHNYFEYKIERYGGDVFYDTFYAYLPDGTPYLAVLYSPTPVLSSFSIYA